MALSESIRELIFRSWSEEADEEERAQLERLLVEDKEVAQEYQGLVRIGLLGKYSGKWPKINGESAWLKIRNRCVEKKNRVIRYWGVAASFVLLVGLAFSLLYLPQLDQSEGMQGGQVSVRPGKAKALLILTSGEEVQLGDHQVGRIIEKGVTIAGDTSFLQYQETGEETTREMAYHELIIPRGGEYRLRLPDGTMVFLNSESRLKYPVTFSGVQRRVWLEGEAYFEVAPDSLSPFVVEAPAVSIKVLGTGFNVMAYPQEGRTEVTLLHGKVGVRAAELKTILSPDEQFVFHSDTKIWNVRKVDVRTFIAWKEGTLMFDAMPLGELVTRLSRWYDVDFFFVAEGLKSLKFSGAFRKYDEIQYVLSLIGETTDVQFVLKNRTVTVYRK